MKFLPVSDDEIYESANDHDGQNEPVKRGRGRPLGSKTKSVKRRRELTLNDFSFLRAVIQGLPAKASAARYLLNANMTSTRALEQYKSDLLLQIIDSARAYAAKFDGQNAAAKTVLNAADVLQAYFDPTAKNTSQAQKVEQAKVPTIQEFMEEDGIEPDFYSEKELIELYLERWGETINKNKEAAKQDGGSGPSKTYSIPTIVGSIGALQSVISVVPNPEDSVATWFYGKFTELVKYHGVLSIRDLANWVNISGRAWYRRLPSMGKTKAARITRWLIDHEDYTKVVIKREIRPLADETNKLEAGLFITQIAIPSHAEQGQVLSTGIVPIESLDWPAHLKGHDGIYRGVGTNTFGANNDIEAIQAWFKTLQEAKPSTLATYQRAIERLVLWAVVERGLALSSLQSQHFIEFKEFMRNPPLHWISKSPALKGSDLWRPMRKPLSDKALELNMQAIAQMFRAWQAANYIHANSALGMTKTKRRDVSLDVSRSLTLKDIGYIRQGIEKLPEGVKRNRIRAILMTLLTSGLRADELIELTWSKVELAQVGLHTSDSHVLRVLGKGNKERLIPIKHEVYQALRRHRDDRIQLAHTSKLNNYSHFLDTDWPIVGVLEYLSPGKALKARTDYSFDCVRAENVTGKLSYERLKVIVSDFLTSCARNAEKTGDDGSRLAKATPHWLRHTFAHLILESSNNDLTTTQALLGHSNIATTGLYVKADLTKRIDSISNIPNLI